MRPFHLLALFSIGASISCGSDTGGGGGADSLVVQFRIQRGGQSLSCSEVAEIDSVEVKVLNNGVEVPGIAKEANCMTSTYAARIAPGTYTLQIIALGQLGAEPAQPLFRSSTQVTLPDTNVEVALQPEVASLMLSWSFETDGNLEPCTDEVDRIDVTVSAGTSGDSFMRSFDCTQTPVTLPTFFRPRGYTVLVEAVNAGGFRVFESREMRVLDNGDNVYAAILEPDGGRLIFGWDFEIPGMPVEADCSANMIGVDMVTTRVTTSLGDDPVEEIVNCVQDVPYIVRERRWSQGQPLMFEVVADGEHRFRYYEEFLMPAEDKNFGVITLTAVGDANVGWTVTSSSGCANEQNVEVDLVVTDMAGNAVVETTVPLETPTVMIIDIPYGEYGVALAGRRNQDILCVAAGTRNVDRRGDNAWTPFEL